MELAAARAPVGGARTAGILTFAGQLQRRRALLARSARRTPEEMLSEGATFWTLRRINGAAPRHVRREEIRPSVPFIEAVACRLNSILLTRQAEVAHAALQSWAEIIRHLRFAIRRALADEAHGGAGLF